MADTSQWHHLAVAQSACGLADQGGGAFIQEEWWNGGLPFEANHTTQPPQ